MNIRIKSIQIGWDVTVSRADFERLRLITNSGSISVNPVSQSKIKLSTLDNNQFLRGCSALTKAGLEFIVETPACG